MTQVVTLEDFTPVARYDAVPWTQARIEEGAAIDGTFSALETQAITPVDADPSNPAARSFTTALASETANLWYRIVFLDASGNDTLPTSPIQNGVLRNYASIEELALLLRVKTSDRRAALQRVLDAAAYEIDAELDRTAAAGPLADPYALSLAGEVNLERAVEHWQQGQSPFGILGLGGETPIGVATDSWNRHAAKLAPLKQQWGLA